MMVLEKLTQSFLRLRSGRLPEVFSRNGAVLIFIEIGDHFCHVSVLSNSNEELLEHLSNGQNRCLESRPSRVLLLAARLLNQVQKSARAYFLSTSDSELASEGSVHAQSNSPSQISVMHRLELGILRQEWSLDLASHGTLMHIVNQVSWILAKDQVSVQQAHLRVDRECFLLSLLAVLNPALFSLGEGHVVFDWANGDHVFDSKFLGDLGGCNESVVLARSH